MIPSKVLQFKLAAGLNETVDPRTAPPGTIQRLKNVAWTKDGRLEKRAGLSAVTKNIDGIGTIGACRRLGVRGSELCLFDGADLFSYSPDLDKWENVGAVPECGITWKPLTAPNSGVLSSDICRLSNGNIVHAWVSGDPTIRDISGNIPRPGNGPLFVEVLDHTTMTRLLGPIKAASTASNVRLVTNGTDYIAVFNAGTSIFASVDAHEGQEIAVDMAYKAAFDAVDTGNGWVLAAEDTDGGIDLFRFNYALNPQITDAVTGEAAVGIDCISIDGRTGGTLFIGYAYSHDAILHALGKARFATADADTLAQIHAPSDVSAVVGDVFYTHLGVAQIDANDCIYMFTRNDANGFGIPETVSNKVTNVGGVGYKHGTYNTNLMSRPFILGGNIYAFLAEAWNSAAFVNMGIGSVVPFPGVTSYLVAVETALCPDHVPHRLVGTFNELTSGNWTIGQHPNVLALSSTQALACMASQEVAPQVTANWLQGDQLVTVSIGTSVPEDLWSSVEAQGELYFATGAFQAYDGRRPFDFGFPSSFLAAALSSTTGGHIVAGDYDYAITPTFTSLADVVHRGPVSPVLHSTVGGTNVGSVDLFLVPQTLACKETTLSFVDSSSEALSVELDIYRTIKDGSTLQKLTFPPRYNVVLNDPTVNINFITDTNDDDSIGAASIHLSTRPVIYTIQELEDFPPPSCITVHLHKNRVFVIAGDKRTVWYSKNFSENPGTAPGFHPTNILTFDQDLVGLATLDDKLIIFAEESIWYVIGDGPAGNGTGSDYSPTKIQTDVGCIAARSIVSEPDGVMFMSSRGLYQLTRSLELQWVGRPVRDTLASFPVITSGVLVHALNQIRFTCNSADGTHGVVLAFDHVRNQWSVFEYADGSTAQTPIADSVLVGETWYFATPAGQVYKEDTATHLDNGQWVTADVETAEMYGEGPLSYQRVRRAYILGERQTDCDLTLRLAVNGLGSYDQSRQWKSDAITSLGDADVGIHVKSQKSASLRMRITDATPTGAGAVVGTGQGVTLSMIGFEIAPKVGMEKRPEAAKK